MKNLNKQKHVLYQVAKVSKIKQLRIILFKNIASKRKLIAVKHLDPCFLTTLVKSKYSKVLLEKSGENKFKCTFKPQRSQP